MNIDIPLSRDRSAIFSKLGVAPDEVAKQAFDEWLLWLTAEKRPTTLSELEVERLYRIYSDPSLRNELTEEHLIRDLKFPVGRVRYLLSSVRKRYPQFLSPRIEDMLKQIDAAKSGQDQTIGFIVRDDEAYIFREIAKNQKWDSKELWMERRGLGQFVVRVSVSLKEDLKSELEKYE